MIIALLHYCSGYLKKASPYLHTCSTRISPELAFKLTSTAMVNMKRSLLETITMTSITRRTDSSQNQRNSTV